MYKIMIIDDEQDICDILSKILEREKYTVRATTDSTQAVDIVREFQPDLIFCDVNMPVMDGFDTIALLRKEKLISQRSFVFLSGADLGENLRKCMRLGADDFLQKPFTTNDILETLKMHIQRKEELKQLMSEQINKHRNSRTQYLSHELNTPLNGILGGSQLLLDYGIDFSLKETEEVLRDIYTSGQQLKTMIDKTLLYESLFIVNDRFVDRDATISEVISQPCLAVAANLQRVADLELELAETDLCINREALTICMQELVENAFKFSSKDQKVIVKGEESNGRYEISISDAGCGMNPEQIDLIGPYRQFDRSIREQQGMGLGLAIVQRLNKLVRLSMKIISTPDSGTTVSLSF